MQPDVVLAGGIGGVEGSPRSPTSAAAGSRHTWSNGLGLLANLHLALAVSTCPYIEVPLDPPAWTPERRELLLPAPLEIIDGAIAPAPGAGLGVIPDLDALETYRVP